MLTTKETTMSLFRGLTMAGALVVAITGCASTPKPTAATPGGEGEAPSAGGGGDITGLGAPKAPERKVTAEQKTAFADALNVYNNMKKRGLKGADCKEAADAFGRAADQAPTLLEARFNQGAAFFECGMDKDAQRVWETMTEGARKYGPALTGLGYLAWKQGDTMRAESMFNRAVDIDKKNVEAHNNLAQILRDKARRSLTPEDRIQYAKQAIDHLRTVLAIDGNNLQAYSTMAFIYYELDKLDLAKLVANQAVARAEEIATGKFQEEVTPEEKDDKAGKKKGGKKAAKKEEAAADTAKTATEVKAPAGAAGGGGGEGYTPEMSRQIAVVYNTLGLIALKRKNVTDAITSFKRAIDMNGNFNEARLNLASIALKFRDYKTADENFRAVLQLQPKNYEAIIGLGVALRGSKKIEEAEQQYLSAQKLDPSNPSSYYNLGLLYQDYKGGDKPVLEKAQQYYRDFLSKANDRTPSDMKEEAETRIKNIDDTYKALEEAKKLQAEAEEMQRKAEEQQKKMEEQMKAQEAAEKAAGGGAAAPAPGAPGAAPTAPGSNAPAGAAPAAAPGGTPPADAGAGKKGKKGKK